MAMSTYDFYTDRVNGPAPKTKEVLPPATSKGLHSLITTRAQANWFAKEFPVRCGDGKGIVDTNHDALWDSARALIPDLPEYPWSSWDEDERDEVLFDLLEFAARRVSEPTESTWHNFFSHYELTFDQKSGRASFRDEVNQILHRGGTMFELDQNLQIIRAGTPAVRKVVEDLTPISGDDKLDKDLRQARDLYQSRRADDRALALERLWDGFERLKTIDLPTGNKRASATALLAHIASPEFRTFVEAEMKSLTDFGNQFTIRHHETDKHPVPDEAQDYLFVRMGSLIIFLLRESERLG